MKTQRDEQGQRQERKGYNKSVSFFKYKKQNKIQIIASKFVKPGGNVDFYWSDVNNTDMFWCTDKTFSPTNTVLL